MQSRTKWLLGGGAVVVVAGLVVGGLVWKKGLEEQALVDAQWNAAAQDTAAEVELLQTRVWALAALESETEAILQENDVDSETEVVEGAASASGHAEGLISDFLVDNDAFSVAEAGQGDYAIFIDDFRSQGLFEKDSGEQESVGIQSGEAEEIVAIFGELDLGDPGEAMSQQVEDIVSFLPAEEHTTAPSSQDVEELQKWGDILKEETAEVQLAAQELVFGTYDAIVEGVDKQYKTAAKDLKKDVKAAQELLDKSEGKVADENTITNLSAAISEAEEVLVEKIEERPSALRAAVESMELSAKRLETTSERVEQSVETRKKEVEEEREEKEKERREREAKKAEDAAERNVVGTAHDCPDGGSVEYRADRNWTVKKAREDAKERGCSTFTEAR